VLQNWHPVWPILHPPTFVASTASAFLLLAMCSIGALFLDVPEHVALSLAMSNKSLEHVIAVLSPTVNSFLIHMHTQLLMDRNSYARLWIRSTTTRSNYAKQLC
jgi:Fungal specific transcription factor domain